MEIQQVQANTETKNNREKGGDHNHRNKTKTRIKCSFRQKKMREMGGLIQGEIQGVKVGEK